MKVRILQFSTTFTQVYTRPKKNSSGSSLAFTLNEGSVRCAKVCNKSWVILKNHDCVIVHVYCKMIEFQSSALIWDRTSKEYLAFFVQTLQIHTLLHMYQRNIHWFDDRFLRECVYSKGRGTQFLSTMDEISNICHKIRRYFLPLKSVKTLLKTYKNCTQKLMHYFPTNKWVSAPY